MDKLLLLLFLVGCKSYQGKLDVVDHLIYKNTHGKTQVLVVGEYETKLQVKKNKTITIRAKNYFEDVKIKLKLDKNIYQFIKSSDNEETTRFNIPRNISGQPFNIDGELTQTTQTGDVKKELQTCSNSPRWDVDCRWYNGRVGYGNRSNTYCQGIPLGTQVVTYRVDLINSSLKLELSNDDQTPNAFIDANSVSEEKVILETSLCRY